MATERHWPTDGKKYSNDGKRETEDMKPRDPHYHPAPALSRLSFATDYDGDPLALDVEMDEDIGAPHWGW